MMLKVGLVGLGFMGRGHLEQYLRLMREGAQVKLVALCDVDGRKFDPSAVQGGNMGDLGKAKYDFSQFALYADFDEMLAKEELDYVDIALPTYLHCYYACRALNAGLHVLCEKPMALDAEQCELMLGAAERAGKTLMIAQCLRFWPAYEELKRTVAAGELGAPVMAYFYRGGGGAPKWSYQDWALDAHRSGGCLLDQHVHDVDMINYVFGMPEAVSALARNVHPGAGYDAVSTQYLFDGFVVNAQDDWSMSGVPFSMSYRVNFEKGALLFEGGAVKKYLADGTEVPVALDPDDGYYREVRYFVEALCAGAKVETCLPESTARSIRIARAEIASADLQGEWIKL